MVLLARVLAMTAAIHPAATHTGAPRAIALEITHVVETEEEAAKMVVTAWYESNFNPNAVGDHGRALCAYQLQNVPAWVRWDLAECTKIAYKRIINSMKTCPEAPFAVYASGNCEHGRKISAFRMLEVSRIMENSNAVAKSDYPIIGWSGLYYGISDSD